MKQSYRRPLVVLMSLAVWVCSGCATGAKQVPSGASTKSIAAASASGAVDGYWAASGNDIYNTNSGNVGIGTTTPGSHRLTLQQAGNGKTGLRIVNGDGSKSLQTWIGSGGAVIDAQGTTNLHLRTGNVDRLFISNETGNVGIGTKTPATPLAILGNGGTKPVGITQKQVGGGATMELTTEGDVAGDQKSRIVLRGGANMTDIEFYTYIGDPVVETNTMFIEGTNGNVGIGTGDPNARLDVVGNIKASGTIQAGSSITIDGSTDTIIASSGTISFGYENLVTSGTIQAGSSITIDGTANTITSSADLDFNVSSGRVLRLEANPLIPNTAGGNIIGGHPDNSVTPGFVAATIAGGGEAGGGNLVTANYGTVGGGGDKTLPVLLPLWPAVTPTPRAGPTPQSAAEEIT